MREVVTLAASLQFPSVLVEFDCLILMETCKGNTIIREIEQIVNDIQKLKENFTSIGFLWTKREGNRVADLIARLGSSGELHWNWVSSPPMALTKLLLEDASIN